MAHGEEHDHDRVLHLRSNFWRDPLSRNCVCVSAFHLTCARVVLKAHG